MDESSEERTDGVDRGPLQTSRSWGAKASSSANLPHQPYLLFPRTQPT